MALDRLDGNPSVSAACQALAPRPGIHAEMLRVRVKQAQIDIGTAPEVMSAEHGTRTRSTRSEGSQRDSVLSRHAPRSARPRRPPLATAPPITEILLKAQPLPGWTLLRRQAPAGIIAAGIDKADALRRSTDHVRFVAIIHNQMQSRSLVTGERLVALGTMAHIMRAQWPPAPTSPAFHRLRRSRLHYHSPTRTTRMRSIINTSVVPAPSGVTLYPRSPRAILPWHRCIRSFPSH